jgi:hypothetical protein
MYYCKKHMILCAQELTMHCVHKLDISAVRTKLKAMSIHTAYTSTILLLYRY